MSDIDQLRSERRHPTKMNALLVDDDVRPGARHQVTLADDFARTFDQHDQDIERAAA